MAFKLSLGVALGSFFVEGVQQDTEHASVTSFLQAFT